MLLKAKIQRKIKGISLGVVVFVMLSTTLIAGVVDSRKAKALISAACRKSPECMAAVEEEKRANAAAMSANSSANFYQARVMELTADIAAKQLEIADTEAQVKDLTKQIAETQAKLELEQNGLAELLVNMHFESDVEPITVLAGASSISDLAEKATRAEVAKQQIAATATKIKEAKNKLEDDKAKVEMLLAEQKAAQEDLIAAKIEQQRLVEKFQNDAEAYQAQVIAAQAAQRAAAKAYRDAHPEETGIYYEGEDTYKSYIYDFGLRQTGGARGYTCPGDWDNNYVTYVDGHKIGGYICECVSYVGWKAYEWYGIYLAWGNAYSWDDRGRALGYTVNNSPAVGAIGQFDSGKYGHVFWVERVNADGSIEVTDYNWNVDGRFTARKISAAVARRYNYIHLEMRHSY